MDKVTKDLTQGVGSSEIGALFGLSQYNTPFTLWERKKGITSFDGNKFTEAGHMLEPVIVKRALEDLGLKKLAYKQFDELFVHPDKPHVRCHPDCLAKDKKGRAFIIEAKHTWKYFNGKRELLPDDWFFQVQYQMGVLRANGIEVNMAYIAVLERGVEFTIFEYPFYEDVWQECLKKVDDFWLHITEDSPPPPIKVSDVMAMVEVSSGDSVKGMSIQIASTVKELREVRLQVKNLKKREEELKDTIATYMMESELLIDVDGSRVASFKSSKPIYDLDKKYLKENYPEAYEESLKDKPRYTRPIKLL